MTTDIMLYPDFFNSIQSEPLVYLFGAGLSASLSGHSYSWWRWIIDGIHNMKDIALAKTYEDSLGRDGSTQNMINIVGEVIKATKTDETYDAWMKEAFESSSITNGDLTKTLKKLLLTQDVFATTNYDLLLEKATGLGTLSYEEPDIAFDMLDRHISNYVLHIHGVYDSIRGKDNIVADEDQYNSVMDNQGAQFIQQILGTRTLIFVGCGKTTEDGNISRFIQFARQHLKMNKQYFFLYRRGETPVGMPDNITLIPYGDDYEDLPRFLESVAQKRIQFKIESNPLILRTVYSTNKKDAYGLSEYHFSNEYLKFCGRKVEIARLLDFLDNDKPFSWWAITGQGGAGKSRLAYELMKVAPVKFFSFFVNHNSDIDSVKKFEPFTDTLVVIDYVKGNEQHISEQISMFILRFATTDYKLRILLLERDNLLLSGSWFDVLEKSFKPVDRGGFLDGEYNTDIALRKHRFLNLVDLDPDAVTELIGDICKKKRLPNDLQRDINLRENYRQKFEQLKFRPLFLQLYVESWINNGCVQIDYQSYTDLLEIVIQREQDRLLKLVDNEIPVCNSLIRLIIRASISDVLEIQNMPEYYHEDWNMIENYTKSHSMLGMQRKQFLQSLLGDASQSVNDDIDVISPQYPDIIKEYMFLHFTDENEIVEISDELWKSCPIEYKNFLSRCILDFNENLLSLGYIRKATEQADNINALQTRLSLLQNKIVHKNEDGPRLIKLAKDEFEFWINIPVSEISACDLKSVQLQGYYYSANQFIGWSMEDEIYQAIDKIAGYYNDSMIIANKISYLMEFAHYFTEKSSHNVSEHICSLIEPIIKDVVDEKERMYFWLSLQREEILNLIYRRSWDKLSDLQEQIFNEIDWEDEKSVELYAYIFCSAVKKCMHIIEWSHLLDYAYILQDLAEDYGGQVRKIYFNDKVHYYYLYSKLMEVETTAISASLTGYGIYGISMVDMLIGEIEDNMMIADFSGLLIGAKALKVGFDDAVTDDMVEQYICEAEMLLERYPDNALLAAKSMDLWQCVYQYQYHCPVPKIIVDKAYALALRFAGEEDALKGFFELLCDSTETSEEKWNYYVNNKQIVNHLIEFQMQEYLVPPIREVETVRRTHKKVSANELCPCGSGKKFKKCCRGNGRYD